MNFIEGNYNLILTDGGAGDLIAELVSVDYNVRKHPKETFHVWVPDYLLELARHLLPHAAIVRPFSKAKEKYRNDYYSLTTGWVSGHSPMRTHPVDYGFHMLSDRHLYDLSEKNYLQIDPEKINISKFNLPERYVCVVATAAEPVKALPLETFFMIVDKIIMHGYTPVFLGKEESECGINEMKTKAEIVIPNTSKGVSLINKTNLLEASRIIHESKAIVGLDSGLIHLAGCTDTNIICGYTLVDPIHVAPIRKGTQTYKFTKIEPDFLIKNRYYQTYRSGFKGGDFRRFPNWENVVASMTPKKFIDALSEIL